MGVEVESSGIHLTWELKEACLQGKSQNTTHGKADHVSLILTIHSVPAAYKMLDIICGPRDHNNKYEVLIKVWI